MKIKSKNLSYKEVLALPQKKKKKPLRPALFFRWLLKFIGAGDLKATNFTCTKLGMEKLRPCENALILMNHSSFIDLKIAATILYPRPFNIICTSDGFVGKEWLMRRLGCIPTKKFVTDLGLVKDMIYASEKLHDSILMYPEASYSFDGTATPLPDSLGKCVKLLGLPVIMIKTQGAFSRDPLYNMLQLRRVDVSAEMKYLLSPKEVEEKSPEEINEILAKEFTFDNWRWQQDNEIIIKESFRADGLNRVLYKCPSCKKEGFMIGKGVNLSCKACGKEWKLSENGFLESDDEVYFNHVPDWYAWERQCVKEEILNGSYKLDIDVDISMLRGMDCLYNIGGGHLVHDNEGFKLTGANGELNFSVKPLASYSIYSDFYWYEIADMICIGDSKTLYYCFPKNGENVVAKTRLAAEELYKLVKSKQALK